MNEMNSYRSRTPGYESQGAEGMAPDLDNKIIQPKFPLLNRHPYLQQVLLHNLVFLPEQLLHIPIDADVATGEPLLPFLRQKHNGAGCQLDSIDQYRCEMNVRGFSGRWKKGGDGLLLDIPDAMALGITSMASSVATAP